jgi:hypothetical protein
MEGGEVGNYRNKIMTIHNHMKSDINKMKFKVYILALYFFPPAEVSLINKEVTKHQANYYYLKVT